MQCFAVVRGGWNQVLPESVEAALKCETPTIGAVAFYMDRQDAIQVISEMISAVSVLMNVGKNIRSEQIAMISEMIYSEFRHLTIADFRAAMRMGALGKFGTSYDRLDVQVISEWCTKFFELRCNLAEGKSSVQNNEIKRNGKEMPMPEWFLEFAKKIEKRAELQQPKKFVPDQLILQQWRIDFEQLPENNRPKWESYVSFQVAKLSK